MKRTIYPTHTAEAVIQPDTEDALIELLANAFGLPASIFSDLETGRSTVTIFLRNAHEWSADLAARLSLEWSRLAPNHAALPKFTVRRLRKRDWAEAWKRHFKPIRIGDTLLVRPPWLKPPAPSGCKVVVLEPGLSFGTGQHPTTSFCLREIVRLRGKALSFLDMGTGSGILAIAAAKLGYKPVRGFDNDPEAVRVARANARKNRSEKHVHTTLCDLNAPRPPKAKADLVCANLISSLLLERRDRIIPCVAPGGWLVLAGILESEFPEIQRCYEEAGMRLLRSRKQKEWQSGSFQGR
jgi:ribosomal protein L11 methyltransferase